MSALRKRIVVGLLGVAVAAGGGIAFAASQSSDPRDEYLNDVAKRLNVTPEKLREAMKGASLDQLEQAVKDGDLTQQQADRIKQKIEASGGEVPFLGGKGRVFGGGSERHHFGFGFGVFRAELEKVADYLGVSVADLRKELADGKSLTDVAKTENKDVDGLKKVITDAAKARLDKAVKDGDMTQKQADEIAKRLEEHVDELVELAPPKFRGFKGGPHFKGGPGFAVPAPGGPRLHGGPGRAFGFGALGGEIAAVADYLGLSRAKLREQIADGKSLADIAKAQGKDVDGLKKVIAERARKRLAEAVKDGHLTQKQADTMGEKLEEHLDDIVEMSLPRWRHP
ncbi:MAG TPA: hypothetical protein VFZ89_19165 [Solirubrobacteraceae bacterium]